MLTRTEPEAQSQSNLTEQAVNHLHGTCYVWLLPWGLSSQLSHREPVKLALWYSPLLKCSVTVAQVHGKHYVCAKIQPQSGDGRCRLLGCVHTYTLFTRVWISWWICKLGAFSPRFCFFYTEKNPSEPNCISTNHMRTFNLLIAQMCLG